MEISKEEYDLLRMCAYKYGGCPLCNNLIFHKENKIFTCMLDGHNIHAYPKDRVCIDGSGFQVKL